jgi:hypothetical protein
MSLIAYKIGAKPNNCSFNAQIECNQPKLHTINHPPAPVQGGRQTAFDLHKSSTNRAFQGFGNRLAYRLLPRS